MAQMLGGRIGGGGARSGLTVAETLSFHSSDGLVRSGRLGPLTPAYQSLQPAHDGPHF
jgi:hypothetical protein